MDDTRTLTVTLPVDMADLVDARVASGEYATGSEVVRDGLQVLLERDAAVERWLRTEVAETYDAHMKEPARAIPAADVLAGLERRFAVAKAFALDA